MNNKTIETQNFIPHPEKKGIMKYLSQRKSIEVFEDIKTALFKLIDESLNESIDYIYINKELESKDIPKGTLVAFSYFDGNESYRVSVAILENSEKYTSLFSMKVWGLEENLKILNSLTIILDY